MFFRIKKIKSKEYSYIVENQWGEKGSRQKVKGYLGRLYRFDLKSKIDFLDFMKVSNSADYVKNNKKDQLICDLIEWELFRFGISKQEFLIDLNCPKIQKKTKNVVFFINDGFLCGLTIGNLLNFNVKGDEQIDGYGFARAFVEAGIKVPKEVFVGIFGKLQNND